MNFRNRICQTLHDEHVASIALMERLEQAFARYRKNAPDAKDPIVAQLLTDLAIGIEDELSRHFDFEEEQLFSYLSAAGDQAIGAHLTGEHAVIRPLGTALVGCVITMGGVCLNDEEMAKSADQTSFGTPETTETPGALRSPPVDYGDPAACYHPRRSRVHLGSVG